MARRGLVMNGVGYKVLRNLGKKRGVSYAEIETPGVLMETRDQSEPTKSNEPEGKMVVVFSAWFGWREIEPEDRPLPRITKTRRF